MLQIRRLLYPTDCSEGAQRAFPQAAFLADWHDAELHLLNVTGRHRHDYPDAQEQFPVPPDMLTDWLRRPGDGASDADGPDLPALSLVQEQVESAHPADAILSYADEHTVDLIVMGTHGRRGVDRMLFGSVTEEVVRKAACPTLTVRADADGPPDQTVRRVLTPIDFSDASGVAIDHAKEIALTYGAEIDLLHVVEEPSYPSAYGADVGPFPTREVLDRVEAQLATMAEHDIGYEHVMVEARTGHPPSTILEYAEETGADLIVIATHGRTGLDRMLLGSVAERVLRQSPVPVFIVRPDRTGLLPSSAAAASAEG